MIKDNLISFPPYLVLLCHLLAQPMLISFSAHLKCQIVQFCLTPCSAGNPKCSC